MTFSTDNVRQSDTKFPAVKLAQNEYWRVVIAEPQPTYEWVHTLRKPKLSPIDGKLQVREVTNKDGSKREVTDMDFVGSPRCLGSIDILEDRGIDNDHCPACQAALDYPDFFTRPERRFAVHVLKYSTKSGTSQVAPGPLNLETKVWRMSEARYAKVAQVIEEFGGENPDPTKIDLVLGPCTNAMYQNYEIAGSPQCYVARDEASWARAVETFEGNNAGDLTPYCGRKSDAGQINADIKEIVGRWKSAQAGGAPVEQPDFSNTLAQSGAGLLEGATAKRSEPEPAPTVDLASGLDDTVGGAANDDPPFEEKAEAPAPSAGSSSGKTAVSFADLMGSLPQRS
jgi:hypothetical protein